MRLSTKTTKPPKTKNNNNKDEAVAEAKAEGEPANPNLRGEASPIQMDHQKPVVGFIGVGAAVPITARTRKSARGLTSLPHHRNRTAC